MAGVKLHILYGKRSQDGTTFYKDEACTQFVAHDPWHKHRTNKVITLNCFKYQLIMK